MITYPHICHHCNHEWEEKYSIKASPPTVCPECKTEGKVERLVAGGSGRGIVPLVGRELTEKLKSDANDTIREAGRNENLLANLVGEDKYHKNELDRAKR